MKASTTADPLVFLEKIQGALEQDEAAYQKLLFRCRELTENPTLSRSSSMVWTEDAQGVTSAALLAPPNPMWLFCEPHQKETSLQLLINMLRDVPFKRVVSKSHIIASFSGLIQQMFGCSVRPLRHERVLKLNRCAADPFVAGYMRLATAIDTDQIGEWLDEVSIEQTKSPADEVAKHNLLEEIHRGNVYVWDDGLMVSMLNRSMPTRHGIALDHLYTPPPLRNRGYASALVNALCSQLFQEGFSFSALTFDPNNAVAGHIFQRLGFTMVCDLDEIEVIS